jgi:hypothetical protein
MHKKCLENPSKFVLSSNTLLMLPNMLYRIKATLRIAAEESISAAMYVRLSSVYQNLRQIAFLEQNV